MSEPDTDKLARVRSMAAGGDTWYLSPNDRAALLHVLDLLTNAEWDLATETAARAALRTQESRALGMLADAGAPVDLLDGVARVVRERDEARAKSAQHVEHLESLTQERDRLRVDIGVAYCSVASGVWFWQGEGDRPKSLTCPVVMSADTLRNLVRERDDARATAQHRGFMARGFRRCLRKAASIGYGRDLSPMEFGRALASQCLALFDRHDAKNGVEMVFGSTPEQMVAVEVRRIEGKSFAALRDEAYAARDAAVAERDEARAALAKAHAFLADVSSETTQGAVARADISERRADQWRARCKEEAMRCERAERTAHAAGRAEGLREGFDIAVEHATISPNDGWRYTRRTIEWDDARKRLDALLETKS